MSQLDRLKKELEKIENELKIISSFHRTAALLAFVRRLHGERSFILKHIKELESTKEEKERERQERLAKANKNRSEKNKRNWRYIGSIQQTYFPDKSKKEIRSSFRKHKKGLETDIPDVVWRNPSP